MALVPVRFEYLTGLRQPFLVNARLTGNWDAQGLRSEQWTEAPMTAFTAEDGCPAFRATINLDDSQIGQDFRWGVSVDTPRQPNVWGIPTEVNDTAVSRALPHLHPARGQPDRAVLFDSLPEVGGQQAVCESPSGRRRSASRYGPRTPRNVELVRGEPVGGYIYNDGRGVTASLPMQRGEDGIWTTSLTDAPVLARFGDFDHTPYMFRITKDDGSVAYRTDLYSRCQIGSGGVNPEIDPSWSGRRQDLDGSKSCSVVVDPEQVTALFHEGVWPETQWLSEAEFWQNEFDPDHARCRPASRTW